MGIPYRAFRAILGHANDICIPRHGQSAARPSLGRCLSSEWRPYSRIAGRGLGDPTRFSFPQKSHQVGVASLRIGLGEDDAVHFVAVAAGRPIVDDGLYVESGGGEFADENFLRYAVSDAIFGDAFRNL